MSKHTHTLIRAAKDIGWSYEGQSGGGHMIFAHPTGKRISASSTPSDPHAMKNALKDMAKKLTAQLA